MKKTYEKPYMIDFGCIGESAMGFISVAEGTKKLPFAIERTFWTYFTPNSVERGRHAHFRTQMVLIAVNGRIIVNTELPDGEKATYMLEQPRYGLYLPPLCWHTMQYSHAAVQLVLASTPYDESDYIRSYEDFLKLR